MKVSVITINRNNADGLRKTMESVYRQSNRGFEYIVVDGASSDGSVEVMEDYIACFKASGILIDAKSELDTGLYNAMNKGVRKAMGDYVLMLNSGDYFINGQVIENILPFLDGTDIVQGNIIREVGGKLVVERGYGRSDINFIDVQKGFFLHQASFCRRNLFEKFGFFDESYLINADTVFYIKALGYGDASFKYVNLDIAFFEEGGRSSQENEAWQKKRKEEFNRWSNELFSRRLWNTCIECDKTSRLYNKLHRHKWAWNITMLVVRIINWIEK